MKLCLVKTGLVFGIVLLSEIYLTGIINRHFSVDPAKMIFNIPQINERMLAHQKDAVYVPYRVRKVIFNQSIYLWQMGRNIANFLSLNNINQTILLANLYPLVLGVKEVWLEKKGIWWLWGIMAGLLVVGINKMVDARAATWSWLPILVYLIYRGIRKMNWRWYGIMLLTSLLVRI